MADFVQSAQKWPLRDVPVGSFLSHVDNALQTLGEREDGTEFRVGSKRVRVEVEASETREA
ncbi:MAG: hypothetical protein OXG04_02990 [Acidobacteria bacterium]|nr:hypothetical protein [Acidobacteriota bacterium]